MKYRNFASMLYGCPLLLLPERAMELDAFFQARMHGMAGFTEAELAEMKRANEPPSHEKGQGIAVVPLFGTVHQHASAMDSASGGTSLTRFQRNLKDAAADSSIGTIVMEIHSPGGSSYGVKETADLVDRISKEKRVVSMVNSRMASAALYIGAAANHVVITPGGDAGSLGVVSMHQDVSKMEENDGVKTTLVAVPAKKVAGHPYAPLDEETAKEMMRQNTALYDQFVADVAKYRGGGKQKVIDNYGGGGMLMASEAKAAGMVDEIATFDEVIGDILSHARAKGAGNRNKMAMTLAELG